MTSPWPRKPSGAPVSVTVIEVPDATISALETGIGQLLQLADGPKRPAIIAIFFAGHGFQDGVDNFIVPKDAKLASLLRDSTAVSSVVAGLAPRKVGITFLFLDACRTLTLSHANSENSAPATVRPGFGQVASFDGAVVSFAPGFNQAALSRADERAVNSPYTEGIQLHLNTEAAVASVLGGIYRHVKIRTNDRQQPATLTQASIDTIRFMPLTAPTERDAEERQWQAVVTSNRRECVQNFLLSFPDSRFAISALKWLAEAPSSSSHGSGGDPCPQR